MVFFHDRIDGGWNQRSIAGFNEASLGRDKPKDPAKDEVPSTALDFVPGIPFWRAVAASRVEITPRSDGSPLTPLRLAPDACPLTTPTPL